MILFNSSIFPRLTLVSSAILVVQLGQVRSDCEVTAVQAVNGSDGITLDSVTLAYDDDSFVKLDVTHAVQAWILDPAANKGILLSFKSCEAQMSDLTNDNTFLRLEMEQVNKRQKRSQVRRRRKQPKSQENLMHRSAKESALLGIDQ